MTSFPKLKTDAVLQYPGSRQFHYETKVARFVDGMQQSFRLSASPLQRWEIRLDLVDDSEMAAIEQFFTDYDGGFSYFSFINPWDGKEYTGCSLENDRLAIHSLREGIGRTLLIVQENRN